jgi:hypothetical protein
MQIPQISGALYELLLMDGWMDKLGWQQDHPFSSEK